MPLTEVADLDQTRVRQSNTEAALVALLADPTRVINIGNDLSIVDDVSCNDLAVSATVSLPSDSLSALSILEAGARRWLLTSSQTFDGSKSFSSLANFSAGVDVIAPFKLGGSTVHASQTQLDYNIVTPGAGTASKSVVLDASKGVTGITNISTATLTTTGLATLNSLSLGGTLVSASASQIDYNIVTPGAGTASKSVVLDSGKGVTGITNISTATLTTTGLATLNSLSLGGTLVSASAAQIDYNIVTPGAGTASKAVVLDSGKGVTGITNISTATLTTTGLATLNSLTLAGSSCTSSGTQLSFCNVTAGAGTA